MQLQIEAEQKDDLNCLADLYLIDGNNIAHKAFHAVPDHFSCVLEDGTTLYSGALYGFTSMMFKLVCDFQPKGLAVCWDTKPLHRLAIDDNYKGHRASTDDKLKQQFPHFPVLVDAFGYPNVSVQGWEADDVLATLATQASAAGIKTCVVTNDRDSFQLVDENVSVMTTPKGFNDPVIYTPEKVVERYGINPLQVPDYLGLKGDPGDAIPGVPKVGEKTASKLVAEYGSLEAVLEAAPSMKQSVMRDNLIEFADQARSSKDLATVRRTLEVDITPEEIVGRAADRSKLPSVLARYQFTAFERQLALVL